MPQRHVRLVQLEEHPRQFQVRLDDVLLLEAAVELFFSVPQQPELEVALAQPRLPPPVFEIIPGIKKINLELSH